MIFALEGNFAYSFMLGVLAAVNPCGFVLLPAYLLYFLGIDSDNKQAPVRRALVVSAAVSSGFLLVFVIIGTISRLFTQWIEDQVKQEFCGQHMHSKCPSSSHVDSPQLNYISKFMTYIGVKNRLYNK